MWQVAQFHTNHEFIRYKEGLGYILELSRCSERHNQIPRKPCLLLFLARPCHVIPVPDCIQIELFRPQFYRSHTTPPDHRLVLHVNAEEMHHGRTISLVVIPRFEVARR